MEMLATSQMKSNMAFELKIQLSEPLENCKILYKFFKISNSQQQQWNKNPEASRKVILQNHTVIFGFYHAYVVAIFKTS